MAYFSIPPEVEQAIWGQVQQWRSQRQAISADAARVGPLMDRYARAYGGFATPDVLLSMAQSGLDPDSSQARALVEADLDRTLQTNPRIAPGQRVNGAQLANIDKELPPETPYEDRGILGKIGWWAESAVRGAFLGLSAPFEELSAGITSVADAVINPQQGFGSDVARNFTREAAPSGLRLAFGELFNRIEEDGFQWSDLTRDSEEFIGGGFFPAGEIARVREEQKHNLEVNGHYLTPGRSVVSLFTPLEEGTRPYNLLSGVTDFAANIFADPTNLLGGAGFAGHAVRSADDIAELLPEAHRLGSALAQAQLRGPRRTIDVNGVQYGLFGGNRAAAETVERLTAMTDANRIRKASEGRFGVETAVQLADAQTPDEVVRVLREGLGMEIRRQRPGISGPAGTVIPEIEPLTGLPRIGRHWVSDRNTVTRRILEDTRALQFTPASNKIDINDLDTSAETMDRWLANARVLTEQRDPLVSRLMRLRVLDDPIAARTEMRTIMFDAMTVTQDRLVELGVAQERVKGVIGDLTRFYTGTHEASRIYTVNAADAAHAHLPTIGGQLDIFKPGQARPDRIDINDVSDIPIVLSGETHLAVPGPTRISQLSDDLLALPSWQAIRDEVTRLGRLKNIPGVQLAGEVAEGAAKVWVQVNLLRPALALRVGGENMLRMLAAGMDTLVNHPAQFLFVMLNRKSRQLLIDGNPMAGFHEYQKAQSSIAQLTDRYGRGIPTRVASPEYEWINRDADGALSAWAGRLRNLASDDFVRKVAEVGPDRAADWLMSPSGSGYLAEANMRVWDGNMNSIENARYQAKIQDIELRSFTSDNPTLISEIAHGNVGGVHWTDDTSLDNIGAELEPYLTSAPLQVPRLRPPSKGSRAVKRWDEFMSHMFDHVSKSEDLFNRGPAFLQSYFDEALRLTPWMSDEAFEATLKSATAYRLGGERSALVREMRARFKAAGPAPATRPIQSAEEAHRLAGHVAGRHVRSLLYDATRRQQWTESARLISPFAEPWRDTLVTWSKLVAGSRGRVLRRAQQTIHGGRVMDLTGQDEGDQGRGFFYKNDRGEEMFGYPDWMLYGALTAGGAGLGQMAGRALGGAAGAAASALVPGGAIARTLARPAVSAIGQIAGGVAGAAIGAGIAHAGTEAAGAGGDTRGHFVGRVSGLNLMGTGIGPGVGPAITLPASFLHERMPQADWLWDRILPTGPEDTSGGLLESQAPAWAQRLLTTLQNNPESERLYGNTVADLMGVLAAEGDYLGANGALDVTQAGRLQEDAAGRATPLFFLRAAAQFILPTGPQVEFRADTPEGQVEFNALAREYRAIRDTHVDGDGAMAEFIDRFGTRFLFATQPASRSIRERSVDPTGADWERQHPEVVAEFRSIVGYLAPHSDPQAPIDFSAYHRSLQQGDRVTLTPQQQLRLYNNTVAGAIYRAQREHVLGENRRTGRRGLTREQSIYFSDLERQLMEDYPGFRSESGLPGRDDLEVTIAELSNAVYDEDVIDASPDYVIQPTRDYLTAREGAFEEVRRLTGTSAINFATASDDRIVLIREALRAKAGMLINRYPEWASIWSGVFERELEPDRPSEPTGSLTWSQWPGSQAALGVN